MRTPFGAECPYYYADHARGRERQECRLLGAWHGQKGWTSNLCARCPVPGIHRANACPDLRLHGRIRDGFLGLGRKVVVTASCVRSGGAVEAPEIGCGLCHPPVPLSSEDTS